MPLVRDLSGNKPINLNNIDVHISEPLLGNNATLTSRLASAAASTNATSVTTKQTTLKNMSCRVVAATTKFLRLYDLARVPVPGTDVPRKIIPLPGSYAVNIPLIDGMNFVNGLAYAITGAGGDTDTTALTAGDVTELNIDYMWTP
jgi:hypothetical protein